MDRLNFCGRQLTVIKLNAMQHRSTMHHHDVRPGFHFRMRPLLEPIIGSEAFLQPFCENCGERVVPENVVMLIHDHKVRLLTSVTNALKDALGILRIRRVSRRAGPIDQASYCRVGGLPLKWRS
jgi:hypothetical protein